ncbi:MAG: hypothetical protein AAFP19_09170 [Bacteroidota bacterium]
MKLTITFLFWSLSLSCHLSSQDADFQGLLQNYRKDYLIQYPILGSQFGQGEVDHLLPIADAAYRERERMMYEHYMEEIKQVAPSRLNSTLQGEYHRLWRELEQGWKRAQSNETYWQDPTLYDAGLAIKYILEREDLSIRQRMANIYKRLQQIPPYYEAAKKNIQKAKIRQLNLALRLNRAGFSYLRKDLRTQAQKSVLSSQEQQRFMEKLRLAELAIKDYIAFCNSLIFDHYDRERYE